MEKQLDLKSRQLEQSIKESEYWEDLYKKSQIQLEESQTKLRATILNDNPHENSLNINPNRVSSIHNFKERKMPALSLA